MAKSKSSERPTPAWLANCALWVAEAEALAPRLRREEVRPVRCVTAVPDAAAFQGWAALDTPALDLDSLWRRTLGRGDAFTLDFGAHQVGYLRLRLESDQWFNDAPVRLRLVFGEVLSEVAEPFDPHSSWLSRAWLQDVQVDIDDLPAEVRLPRRYAFRFLRVEVVDTSDSFKVRFADCVCETVTSAGADLGNPPEAPLDRHIDAASVRTLRQCMQTVFEDGPKRDRRLWLGDLRLQALANYVSFQDYDLVKRCLLLHAGLARPQDGVISACIYDRPLPSMGRDFILDYAALFGPTLLDYVRASGDLALAEKLWPVALHQIDHCLGYVDSETGIFRNTDNIWIFLDWQPDLHKEAGLHAVLVYSARRTAELGRLVGRESEARRLDDAAERMAEAAYERLRDPATGLYISGPERQVSWATQAWMVLAGIPKNQPEAAALFDALDTAHDAVRPAGPYLWHHIVDALYTCGRGEQALTLLRSYWGGMLSRGATTFWEVFDPEKERLSPYGTPLVNSYCHAWSCTPTYFLRGRHPGSTAAE